MSDLKRIGALDVGQDLAFQRREWTVQRVGWVVMAVLVLAALLGLFGVGPLSAATVDEGGLTVEYARFTRYRAPGTLRFAIPAEATTSGQVRLWLDRGTLDEIEVQAFVPEPDSAAGGEDRVVYTFQADEPGQPMVVVLDLTHEALGTRTIRAGIIDGPDVSFWQLTYP
jgi:hypothetical protein